jgi:hypothetical protein
MQDCQWGATLHAHGLLRAGFVPPADIRRLQDYMRLRADHIEMAAAHIQHMQQALERMNIKLHDVIAKLIPASAAWRWCAPSLTANAIRSGSFYCATPRFSAPKPSA